MTQILVLVKISDAICKYKWTHAKCKTCVHGAYSAEWSLWEFSGLLFFLNHKGRHTHDPGLQLPIVLVIQQSTEYSSYKVCFSSHATIVFIIIFLIIADMGKMFVFTSLKRIKNSIKAKNLMNFGKTPITIKS